MKKLRSRVTTDGLDRAPHRAFMRAMGLDDAAIEKPMIGVVSMKGEQTPCNMTHGFQVDAAKAGIAEAGGTPREFTTISVSDGISMNHEGMKFSLVSRELIADSIEAVVHGLAYDALVGFGGCDKTLPGVMMGMIRCNVPSIFVYGGSALPGPLRGKDPDGAGFLRGRRRLHDRRDGRGDAGGHRADLPADDRRLRRPIHRQHDGDGVGGAGAHGARTCRWCRASMPSARHCPPRRRMVMEMLQRGGPLPREIVTRKSLENGCAIVAATGGSTNAALHLPAIANEAGISFTLDDVGEVFARTPLIGDLRPGGKYTAKDVYDIGGTAVIIRALIDSGHIDGDCLTITGSTLAEEYGAATRPDGEIVSATGTPICRTAGSRC